MLRSRTPAFALLSESSGDITGKMLSRMMRLVVVDAAGFESDTVEIELDDRDRRIVIPPIEERIQVWMGYEERGVVQMGTYIVDEIGLPWAPYRVEIGGKAANMLRGIKAPKSRTWHGTTIGELVSTIAGEHQLEPSIDPQLRAVAVPHLDQGSESDLHLLQRLAQQYDAVSKPAFGQLRFWRAAANRADELERVTVRATDQTTGRVRQTSRTKYQGVAAYYYDPDRAERVPVYAGSGEPRFTIRHDYRDATQAQDAAEAKLTQLLRGIGVLELTMPGDPRIRAEKIIDLSGIRDGVDGEWLVTRATHTIDDGGYSLRVEGEVPK